VKQRLSLPIAAALPEPLQRRQEWNEFMRQARAHDYHKWPPSIQFGIPDRSDDQIIQEAETGRYRYLAIFNDAPGCLRLRFLKTCEELHIPQKLMPSFDEVVLPNPMMANAGMPPFVPPPFDVVLDSAEAWRKKADQQWGEYCKVCLGKTRDAIRRAVDAGMLIPQKRRREHGKASAMDFRFQWAVLHHCSNWSYGKLHKSRYNPERKYSESAITRATQRLLDELGLPR